MCIHCIIRPSSLLSILKKKKHPYSHLRLKNSITFHSHIQIHYHSWHAVHHLLLYNINIFFSWRSKEKKTQLILIQFRIRMNILVLSAFKYNIEQFASSSISLFMSYFEIYAHIIRSQLNLILTQSQNVKNHFQYTLWIPLLIKSGYSSTTWVKALLWTSWNAYIEYQWLRLHYFEHNCIWCHEIK